MCENSSIKSLIRHKHPTPVTDQLTASASVLRSPILEKRIAVSIKLYTNKLPTHIFDVTFSTDYLRTPLEGN